MFAENMHEDMSTGMIRKDQLLMGALWALILRDHSPDNIPLRPKLLKHFDLYLLSEVLITCHYNEM